MPITIGPPFPISPMSPGQLIAWFSDFVGPLPIGSALTMQITTDAEGQQVLGHAAIQTTAKQGQFVVMDPKDQWQAGSFAVADGANVFLQMHLIEGGTNQQVDSGTHEMTWHPNSSSALLLTDLPTTGGGGGLTSEQALQLQEANQATWPQTLVDHLTLVGLGTGDSNTPINANLGSPVFGIIVRLTSVPADISPQTPDGDYWVQTLAVVRIFRGADLWLRVPIHTSSKLINLWVEGLALGLVDAVLSAGWLLNLTLQTTFLPGVSGQVFLMRLP